MHTPTQAQIEKYTAKGWWGTETVDAVFRRNVAEHPDRVAVVDPPNRAAFTTDEPQRLTYAELEARVRDLCAPLSSAGLGPHRILVAQLPNVADLIVAYLAAARLGAMVSPVPVQFGERDLSGIVALLKPQVYLAASEYREANPAWGLAAAAEPVGGTFLALGDAPPVGAVPLAHTRAEIFAGASLEHPADANDAFTVCWTSGTEAPPKGVPRSHNHWWALARGLIDSAELEPGDTILCPFPLVSVLGLVAGFFPWLRLGGTLVLHEPLDVALFLRQLCDERVTTAIAPPAVLDWLIEHEGLLADADLSHLRSIGAAGAPLAPDMVRAFEERYGVPVVNLFVSNEGLALVSGRRDVADPEQRARYFPRFGVPLLKWMSPLSEMVETRLVDPIRERDITRPGTPGELRVRGATMFGGYFRADALTDVAFDERGFFRTGDLFEIVSENHRFYKFLGRLRELIIRGGMNISPDALDLLLADHPLLADAAVVGVPDDVMGERVCVVVVPKAGGSVKLKDVTDFLRQKQVPVYKLPERFVLAESLPRNALGKVVRRELRSLYEAYKG